MQPNSSLRRVGIAVLIGSSSIAGYILLQAMAGSVFFKGNLVTTGDNPTPCLVQKTIPFPCWVVTPDSGTGGVKSGNATYDSIIAASPFNSTASTRGLKTGTAAITAIVLSLPAPQGASFDCSVVDTVNSATGTVLLNNVSVTGATVYHLTGAIMGPTQYLKCGTRTTVRGSLSGYLLTEWVYSPVVN